MNTFIEFYALVGPDDRIYDSTRQPSRDEATMRAHALLKYANEGRARFWKRLHGKGYRVVHFREVSE
jgi:hypothetical protein